MAIRTLRVCTFCVRRTLLGTSRSCARQYERLNSHGRPQLSIRARRRVRDAFRPRGRLAQSVLFQVSLPGAELEALFRELCVCFWVYVKS
jgi:hypothetical protein